MSFVVTFIRSSLLAVFVFFCLVSTLVHADTMSKNSKSSKHSRKSNPITKGWEPVSEVKPVTRGWQTIAKSAVLQRKLNQLTDKDYAAALKAVHYALSEVEDGKVYYWKRKDNRLRGKVMPTNAFKDKEGRICRHIIYTLSLDQYRKTVEGIACRSLNGGWSLSG